MYKVKLLLKIYIKFEEFYLRNLLNEINCIC